MRGKAAQLVDDVKGKIDSGVLGYGLKLPSTHDFAKTYGMTYPTAHKAIRKLADLGYVYRKQGQGTYVARHVKPRTRTVGLAIRTAGHVYGDVAYEVLNSLQDSGYTSRVIPLGTNGDAGMLPAAAAAIEGLLSANPYAIIADQEAGSAYKALFERALSSGIPVIWKFCHEPPAGLFNDFEDGFFALARCGGGQDRADRGNGLAVPADDLPRIAVLALDLEHQGLVAGNLGDTDVLGIIDQVIEDRLDQYFHGASLRIGALRIARTCADQAAQPHRLLGAGVGRRGFRFGGRFRLGRRVGHRRILRVRCRGFRLGRRFLRHGLGFGR